MWNFVMCSWRVPAILKAKIEWALVLVQHYSSLVHPNRKMFNWQNGIIAPTGVLSWAVNLKTLSE